LIVLSDLEPIDRLPARIGPVYALPNVLAGAVAERFGAPLALAGGGLVTLLVAAIVVVAYRLLRVVHADPARACTAKNL